MELIAGGTARSRTPLEWELIAGATARSRTRLLLGVGHIWSES